MESEKVYVHYQGHPEFTYIAKLDPLLTVAQLTQDFATAYRAKYGLQHMLDLSCIEVFSERHKPLMRSMVLKKVAKNRYVILVDWLIKKLVFLKSCWCVISFLLFALSKM
jgi:hypothetical protein